MTPYDIDIQNPPNPPLRASPEEVMKAWEWYRKYGYSTVYGRELYQPYMRFFYNHEMTMFEMAKKGLDAAAKR